MGRRESSSRSKDTVSLPCCQAIGREVRILHHREGQYPLDDRYGDAALPLQLDVTDRSAAFARVKRAADHFGKLDVIINNAGYGHFGMVEELTEEEVRSQLETNFFGALWVTQAALPIMRTQRSGHIIQVTSLGGITAFPAIGAYPGGGGLRHQGDAGRAWRILDRLGRPIGQAQCGEPGLRRCPRGAKPLVG